MNLKFLETFVWVARLKSFRLTAEKLSSTQTSISSRIATLEGELGVKLFLRDSRGVTLTPEGNRVLEYAEQLLDTAQAMRQSLEAGRGGAGRVRIGMMDTVVHTWLGPLMAKIAGQLPALEVELTVDTALNLGEQLGKGYLDLVLQTDPVRHESVRNLALGSYPLCWLAAQGTPLAHTWAGLEALVGERVATFSRHSRPHLDLLSLLQAHGVSLPRLSCINSVAAMTRLVCDGFAVGALPPALLTDELDSGRLLRLGNLPSPPDLPLVASWRDGSGLEPVQQVLEVSRASLAEYAVQVGIERFVLAD